MVQLLLVASAENFLFVTDVIVRWSPRFLMESWDTRARALSPGLQRVSISQINVEPISRPRKDERRA
ncbi:unnamed protein product [Angiostrongylus costaricensis]|uniref:Neur_chan_LBD domain-containing protein n=1 Tax=Angiostrongylus costaricensis TaxID=334426 RepID=A0A0R3PYX7_ANGCS|nr:unnamed protein product [Angiostrongylus costaricensis]